MSKKKTIALFSVVVVAMLAFTPMLFACNDDAFAAHSTRRGPYLHSLTRVQCADRR